MLSLSSAISSADDFSEDENNFTRFEFDVDHDEMEGVKLWCWTVGRNAFECATKASAPAAARVNAAHVADSLIIIFRELMSYIVTLDKDCED